MPRFADLREGNSHRKNGREGVQGPALWPHVWLRGNPQMGTRGEPHEILNHFYKIGGIRIKHFTIFKVFNGQ